MTSRRTYGIVIFIAVTAIAALSLMARGHAKKPAATEMGTGPRTSARGLYIATLQNDQPLQPRKMYTLQVSVADHRGQAVEKAAITVEGGMPQHGHGLPTRPRVTKDLGGGVYEISGLRFNMGGWWELKLTITTPAGSDTVTFHLDVGAAAASSASRTAWAPEQLAEIKALSLALLPPLPPDPSNRVADDPRAVALGHRLFFDTRLSANGKVSCATCHMPDREFQDGTPLAQGVGTTSRRTMPIAGTAYAPFLFWDGRKDSQWAQALGPLESPVEHGGNREEYAQVIAAHYRDEYEQLFGPLPDLTRRDGVTSVFVNIGKSIAAYERRIQYAPSRFDRYVQTGNESLLTAEEKAGLALFIGKANCTQCHNGPLLTNNEFHNTGVPVRPMPEPDRGRRTGAKDVLGDEFNCRSRWSDAKPEQCTELEFLAADGHELERAFKVPSLRNVADRPPYMHAGQFATLDEVVAHYNSAPAAPAGHTELKPLKLDAAEVRQLSAFLRTLSGGTAAPKELLQAP